MSSIPMAALRFGGLSINVSPVSYAKTRVSGTQGFSYIMHSRSAYMPGQPFLYKTSATSIPEQSEPLLNNRVINAYKQKSCASSSIPIGPRESEVCPFGFTYKKFAPHDDETLEVAIQASYKQVYGNLHAMDSERSIDSERRLRNGDISIKEFIRHLAMSDFYLENYFHNVNQQRSIELSFKHFLGRPPLNQGEIVTSVELIHQFGFIHLINTLIDSAEYTEVFGEDTVPFSRCWNSPCGLTTSSFNNLAILSRSFSTSDNAIDLEQRSLNGARRAAKLLRNLANGINEKILIPSHSELNE